MNLYREFYRRNLFRIKKSKTFEIHSYHFGIISFVFIHFKIGMKTLCNVQPHFRIPFWASCCLSLCLFVCALTFFYVLVCIYTICKILLDCFYLLFMCKILLNWHNSIFCLGNPVCKYVFLCFCEKYYCIDKLLESVSSTTL